MELPGAAETITALVRGRGAGLHFSADDGAGRPPSHRHWKLRIEFWRSAYSVVADAYSRSSKTQTVADPCRFCSKPQGLAGAYPISALRMICPTPGGTVLGCFRRWVRLRCAAEGDKAETHLRLSGKGPPMLISDARGN